VVSCFEIPEPTCAQRPSPPPAPPLATGAIVLHMDGEWKFGEGTSCLPLQGVVWC
jgi:hypothetical protein